MKTRTYARALALALTTACAVTVANAQGAPQITAAVSDSNLATLRGSVRPEMTPLNDRGRVADSFAINNMRLVLRRSPQQKAELKKFFSDLENPASPSYRHWLTAAQYNVRFGIAPSDRAKIEGWLTQHGFRISGEMAGGAIIGFSGSAGQVRAAFHTEIHALDVDGERHFANATAPKIPAAFAPAVIGVTMNDFRPHAMHKLARRNFTDPDSNVLALEPEDLATIYNFNPLFAAGTRGNGQTVEVVEDSDILSTDDWTQFRADAGLTKYKKGTLTVGLAPSGPFQCIDPGITGDDTEAMLDIEWASAAAPNAKIVMATCSNVFIALANVIAGPKPPPILSVSFGACETQLGADNNGFLDEALGQGEAEGISIYVSTGDQLNSVCDRGKQQAINGITVNGIASTTHAVGVGGTDFGDTFAGQNGLYWNATNTKFLGSAKSYIPEIPWNDSCGSQLIARFVTGSGRTFGKKGLCNQAIAKADLLLNTDGGSGGPSQCGTGDPDGLNPAAPLAVSGTCAGYAKPTWQRVLGNPADGVRDLPDVSLFAADGIWSHAYRYLNSNTGGYGLAGGTSFAAPIMAGVQALINQKMGGARQGNPNPQFYRLARKEYRTKGKSSCVSARGNAVSATCIFYDVKEGDNDEPCKGIVNCFLPSGKRGVLSTDDASFKPAYRTGTGWDFSTGIGTVNVTNLVNAWQ